MQRYFVSARGVIGLTLLTITGCYSYSPYGYGPYGNGNQPTYQSFPPVGGGPVPGAFPQGTGAYLSPNDFSASQAAVPGSPNYLVQPQPWQQSQKSAPAQSQSAASDSFQPPTTGKRVPDYREPVGGDSQPSKGDAGDFSTPFGPSSSSGVQLQGIQGQTVAGTNQPIAAGARGPVFIGSPESVDQLAEADIDDNAFSSPVRLTPVSSSRTVEARVDQSSVKRPNPYAYDRSSHSWLRGVADYDGRDKTWHLVYDLTPDSQDEYGGDITLIDDQQLDLLKNDDVVLVEGRIDSSVRDRYGKPCYRIKKIDRLVPEVAN